MAAALAIGGCASQAKPPVDLTLVAQIQAAIIGTCGYKVQINSLIAVLNTFVPGAGLASIAVDTICKVVEPLGGGGHASAMDGVLPLVVNGVPLKGHFVAKSAVPVPRPRPK